MTSQPLSLAGRDSRPAWSIERHRVADTSAEVAAFDDDVWPLAALPLTPGSGRVPSVNFAELDGTWSQVARWLAYCWINQPTPAALRDGPNSRHVDYPSAETIRQRVSALIADIQWLRDQGVTEPSDIDDDHLTDLVLRLTGAGSSPGTVDRRLAVFRLWAAAAESLPDAIRLPAGLHVDIPSSTRRQVAGENRTRRIRQATMGPLLWWSLRMVDEYGDTSFELLDLIRDAGAPSGPRPVRNPNRDPVTGRLIADTTGESQIARARTHVDGAITGGNPLPAWREGQIAYSYIEWLHGLTPSALNTAVNERAGEVPIARMPSCPVRDASEMPDGLASFADYYDLIRTEKSWPRLPRLLQAACLITVAYLTGMRPDEVRRLRPGCSEVVTLPGGTVRHLIRGSVTKTAETADGVRAGSRVEVDALWATIPAATRALELAERLRARFSPDSEWIFNNPFSTSVQRAAMDASTAAGEIAHFINAINARRQRETPDGFPNIPSDTHGAITLRRFRRTLAWYVRNQPQGEVTLGIQYQHIGTVVGSGYAAAGTAGWTELLDEEGLETRRRLAKTLRDEFLDGAGISGPAAARAAGAIAEFDAAGGTYMPESDMRRLLAAPGMTIYDNPSNLSLCVYDPDQALCERVSPVPGRAADPDLLGCRTGCSNRAMTDAQADLLASRAADTRRQADAAPAPLRNRLLKAAQEMDERVAQHRQSRVVPTVLETEETP